MKESTFNYENLIIHISNQLKNVVFENMEIKYAIAHGFLSLKVSYDVSVSAYIKLKKKKPEITFYPPVITYNHTSIEISAPMIDCYHSCKNKYII